METKYLEIRTDCGKDVEFIYSFIHSIITEHPSCVRHCAKH